MAKSLYFIITVEVYVISSLKTVQKTLASALESVINMVKAVELHEERAKQAKEEVIMAGQDILTKVEDLKQMVKHAQESNDKVVHLILLWFLLQFDGKGTDLIS